MRPLTSFFEVKENGRTDASIFRGCLYVSYRQTTLFSQGCKSMLKMQRQKRKRALFFSISIAKGHYKRDFYNKNGHLSNMIEALFR